MTEPIVESMITYLLACSATFNVLLMSQLIKYIYIDSTTSITKCYYSSAPLQHAEIHRSMLQSPLEYWQAAPLDMTSPGDKGYF